MVYIYARQSLLNKYIGKDCTVDEITNALMDMGMDIKGQSDEADPELKIEITAEKLDMVSVPGIARAVRYYLGLTTDVIRYELKRGSNKVIVKKSAALSRPKTVACILRDVPMTQELLDEIIYVQEKVHESHGRGRKKGAIGIYPVNEIEFPITYGAEKPENIVFWPLEGEREMNAREILEQHHIGKKYAHLLEGHEFYPVFRDARGKVLSMPPIINSHETGRVDMKHRDLFIECSGYNLYHIDNILKSLVTTFIDMGCKAESVLVKYPDSTYELSLDNYEDTVDVDFVNRLIGISITPEESVPLLNKMMYGVKKVEGSLVTVEVPVFRSDVWHDVDIADDIARGYGYNNIVPQFPNLSTVGGMSEFSQFRDRISQSLVGMGFVEVHTDILTSTEYQFRKMGIVEDKGSYVRLVDAADEGLNMARVSLLPEALRTLAHNKRYHYPQKVFENGFTIQPDESTDTKARNEAHLCVCMADSHISYTDIKGVLDSLMEREQIMFEVVESNAEYLIPDRQAKILIDGNVVGLIGEVHPRVLKKYGFNVPIAMLELNLQGLQ